MPEDQTDPSADTQMFRAFVDRREADEREAATTQRASAWKAALLAVVVLLVVAGLWLMLGR